MIVTKKVGLVLVGLNGNAFAILAAFRRQARRDGWSSEEIEAVTKDAQSKDYIHLLCTIMEHCDDPSGSQGEE